jgi:hypothetical protein
MLSACYIISIRGGGVSELITRTARLIPYSKRPKQVPSFVTAYFHEPLPDDPGFEMGSFYIVLEVLISGRASEEVADIIIETVGDNYYNRASSGEDALTRFEAAIRATNHELGEHVSRGNASWIGKLSAVIAMQAGAELHVASTGSAASPPMGPPSRPRRRRRLAPLPPASLRPETASF